jgi:hypothetical protein
LQISESTFQTIDTFKVIRISRTNGKRYFFGTGTTIAARVRSTRRSTTNSATNAAGRFFCSCKVIRCTWCACNLSFQWLVFTTGTFKTKGGTVQILVLTDYTPFTRHFCTGILPPTNGTFDALSRRKSPISRKTTSTTHPTIIGTRPKDLPTQFTGKLTIWTGNAIVEGIVLVL